jgi:hypothetical protein
MTYKRQIRYAMSDNSGWGVKKCEVYSTTPPSQTLIAEKVRYG